MSSPAPVGICLVTHNSKADLPRCVEAIAKLDPGPMELSIVDCASLDGSAEYVQRIALPGVRTAVHCSERNLGFAVGMNTALAAIRAPFVLLLNPDTRPASDYLARLLQAISERPGLRVGAVTGRLRRADLADGRPILDACGMYLTLGWRHLDRGSDAVDSGQWMDPDRVFGGTGAATLFSREALGDVAVAGEVFDGDFHSYREDAELCFRLQERGWEVLYEPSAGAVHIRRNLPRRRRQMPASVNYHSLKNRYLLRIYHQTVGNLVFTALPTLARDLLALGYVLLVERESLGAYAWLWRHRRRLWRRRREIQGRRIVPAWKIDRWFLRRGIPH